MPASSRGATFRIYLPQAAEAEEAEIAASGADLSGVARELRAVFEAP